MDIDGLVVREGDRAAATGRLVRDGRGDWFEPAFPVAGPAGPERRVRAAWQGAVRVAGADFDAVAGRFEKGGAVEGWATITGTWSGEQLGVQRQGAPVAEPAAHARWVTPPCPPPRAAAPRWNAAATSSSPMTSGTWPTPARPSRSPCSIPAATRRSWSWPPLTLPPWRPGCGRSSATRCAWYPAGGPRTSSTTSATSCISAGSSGTYTSSDHSTPKTARPISLPVSSGFSPRSRPGQPHFLRAWWPLNHG